MGLHWLAGLGDGQGVRGSLRQGPRVLASNALPSHHSTVCCPGQHQGETDVPETPVE